MKLCIFDLDGTLLNTIADLGSACNYALGLHGFPLHDADDYPHLVGNGVNKLIERSLPEGYKNEETILRLRNDFINYYDRHNRVKTCPYDGMPELIQTLKQEGCILAVASNKYQSATETLVTHYFGNNTFDIIYGEHEGCPRKPNPQIVCDIVDEVKRKGLNADENGLNDIVFYIGDSDVDMNTAHNASATLPIVSIACTWGFCTEDVLRDCQPDHLIRRSADLLQIVRMMSGALYNACDDNLREDLNETKNKLQDYNNLRPTLLDKRSEMIRTIIHTADDAVFINQPFYCDYGKHIRVGRRFFANFNFTVLDEALVTIGDDCFMGPNVSIYTACHPTDPVERNSRQEWALPVSIGNNVWIGGTVTILPGVTIGDNVTIGAGSVVTKDIPANSIAVGNPAKVIKHL